MQADEVTKGGQIFASAMRRPSYVLFATLAGTLLIALNPIGDLGIGIKAGLVWGFLAYVDYCERQL